MTCDEARQLLHGYIDDELDLASALQMEKHLRECATCRAQAQAARAVRAACSQPGVYFAAPDALRTRLQAAIQKETQTSFWWKQPIRLSSLAAALILIVGLVAVLLPPHGSRAEVAELVASHVRSLEANHLLDVESTDQHTVKPWFDGKLEFAPPVIDLAGEGFPLIGGRLDYLQEGKVAAVVYRRNKHLINVFIWPGEATPETDVRQGFNLIRFQCNGMICWAVSDVNAGELQQFVDLFKAQKSASTRRENFAISME